MAQRIKTAIIFALILIPFIIVGSWPLMILVLLLAYGGLYELLKMKDIKVVSMMGLVAYLGITGIVMMRELLIIMPEFFQSHYYIAAITLLALIVATIDRKSSYEDAALAVLGINYIGFGFYSMFHIRETSLVLLLFIILTIWGTDIGAYLFGRQFGKRKLAPLLSPNKTIEGSVGGVVSAMVLAAIYLLFFELPYPYLFLILVAGLVSVAGQFGDLIESGLKRQYDVKDSGTLFPGHGGILDRFDSLLFALSLCILLGIG